MKPAALFFMLLLISMMVMGKKTRAHAFDDYHWGSTPVQKIGQRRQGRFHKRPKDTRVYGWPRDDDYDDERGPKCLHSFVKVISTEHTTKENAMEAARKMWSFSTQWEHGSKWMQLELAEDYRDTCGQSNAMDTATGKLNEAVSQLAGREGVNVRCVIRARPCRVRLDKAEGHK